MAATATRPCPSAARTAPDGAAPSRGPRLGTAVARGRPRRPPPTASAHAPAPLHSHAHRPSREGPTRASHASAPPSRAGGHGGPGNRLRICPRALAQPRTPAIPRQPDGTCRRAPVQRPERPLQRRDIGLDTRAARIAPRLGTCRRRARPSGQPASRAADRPLAGGRPRAPPAPAAIRWRRAMTTATAATSPAASAPLSTTEAT